MNSLPGPALLDFAPGDERSGFRLQRLEVFNWGTFHERVWCVDARGETTLLTGDIGSGKSTLVDALTTLLVPPQKLAYNKAAGADARERSLRTYVLGHYKSAREDPGSSARPVALRDHNSYSVILAQFQHAGFDQVVTLAQVFWSTAVEGQPARFYVIADKRLSIAEDFSGFGTEIAALRKRLRGVTKEIHDTFPPYASTFRRRFGIQSEQALDLFHQTVSMKSVGNLTQFVRQHMLEAFEVERRIEALLRHFDDLTRAHEAVLKAKAQIARLGPLVESCDREAELARRVDEQRDCRDALAAWFATIKGRLLEERIEGLGLQLAALEEKLSALAEVRRGREETRDGLRESISRSGGDELERIARELERTERQAGERRKASEGYDDLAARVGLPRALDAATFLENRRAAVQLLEKASAEMATEQNALTEASVELRQLKVHHGERAAELDSLRRRRSNLPAQVIDLRDRLCAAVGASPDELPFVGELLQTREEERAWEGAIERVLRSFGLSLLVPDGRYAGVARWVEETDLKGRLVYLRVRPASSAPRKAPGPDSLVRKVSVRPDSEFYGWLEGELARRYDLACCETLEQFGRETQAITRAGQIKTGSERHEKDDRHRLDDRSRYVLGWSNEEKKALLSEEVEELAERGVELVRRVGVHDGRAKLLNTRTATLQQLGLFAEFQTLDWRALALAIVGLEDRRKEIEASSDLLRSLRGQLGDLEAALTKLAAREGVAREHVGARRSELNSAREERLACTTIVDALPEAHRARCFPALDAMRTEALSEEPLRADSCEKRERDMRDWLQGKIDAEDKKLARLRLDVVKEMQMYRTSYPAETKELDANLASADEFRRMHAALVSDDLPRFEAKFKQLLNENTIREVAGFHSELQRERGIIQARIDVINRSLRAIDYNPGRFIVLEPEPTPDAEVRDFQQELRACIEGELTGSEDDAYAEAKFVQVRRIIERFRGRTGTTELDARWTAKVTDVRNWSTFSASERWREDNREHEHYSDSGGKSGGQKEKLAYTVLAASLAYQFGLDVDEKRSRSFRFVVIDEAFARGSDESAAFGLELFQRLHLQLLVVTPLQKIHVIEPFVSSVAFIHNEEGQRSMVRNLTIEQYRAERAARAAAAP